MTRPAPWSREQVEAYLRGDDLFRCAGQLRHALLVERAELVRLCPEAPDYHALADRHFVGHGVVTWDRMTATDDEIRAGVQCAVAALWAKSTAGEASDG